MGVQSIKRKIKLWKEKREYKKLLRSMKILKEHIDPDKFPDLLIILDNFNKKELRRIKLLEIKCRKN